MTTAGRKRIIWNDQPVTNDLAVLMPYQVTFRGFSPEMAQVLEAFATSPHGFIVKTVSVQPEAMFGAAAGDTGGAAAAAARARARQGRIADRPERTTVARHAGRCEAGEIDAKKLNAWNSSKEITRRSS